VEPRIILPETLARAPIRGIAFGFPLFALLLCVFELWLGIAAYVGMLIVTVPLGLSFATTGSYTSSQMRRQFRVGQAVFFGVFGVLLSSAPFLILRLVGDDTPSLFVRRSSLIGGFVYLICTALLAAFLWRRIIREERIKLDAVAATMIDAKRSTWDDPITDAYDDNSRRSPESSKPLLLVALGMGLLPVIAAYLKTDVQDVRLGGLLVLSPIGLFVFLRMLPDEIRTEYLFRALQKHEATTGQTLTYAGMKQVNAVRAKTWLGRRFGPPATADVTARRPRRKQVAAAHTDGERTE
jgi:hypothetical protein